MDAGIRPLTANYFPPSQEKEAAEARERTVWEAAEEAERVLAVADEQVV